MFDNIATSAENKKYFADKIRSHSLSHAHIIAGDANCDKKGFALSVCSALACKSGEMPCGSCVNCQKILSDQCVDIYTIKKPDGRVYMPVDSIRAIYDTVFFKPNDLEFKAYIITDGDKMLPASQNALLKLLEEPPSNVYFFILVSDPSVLLPTITSRCVTVSMRLDSSSVISNEDKSKQNSHILLSLLSESDSKFDFITQHHKLFTKLDDLYSAYTLLLDAFRDISLYKCDTEYEPIYFNSLSEIEGFAQNFSVSSLLNMSSVIAEALCSQKISTRPQLTLSEYSSLLWESKHL